MSLSLSRSLPARYPTRFLACDPTIGSQPSVRVFCSARARSSGFCSGPAGATSATCAPDSSGFAERKCFTCTSDGCGANYAVNLQIACFLIWHMHCFSCSGDKQLWRVAEWLERKRALVRRAAAGPVVVADPPAAAGVQAGGGGGRGGGGGGGQGGGGGGGKPGGGGGGGPR